MKILLIILLTVFLIAWLGHAILTFNATEAKLELPDDLNDPFGKDWPELEESLLRELKKDELES